jgi:hypothetical protein
MHSEVHSMLVQGTELLLEQMNTMAEFFEWVLQAEEHREVNPAQMEEGNDSDSGYAHVPGENPNTVSSVDQVRTPSPDDFRATVPPHSILRYEQLDDDSEESSPSLCHSDSSSSTSLLGDLSMDLSVELGAQSRRLTFNNQVEVREYSLTLGDHPMCEDSLSLSLDWQHADFYYKDLAESQQRGMFYKPPPRLSLRERRDRLIAVTGYTSAELDALMSPPETLGALLGKLKQSWSSFSLRTTEAFNGECSPVDEETAERNPSENLESHSSESSPAREVVRMQSRSPPVRSQCFYT